MSWGAAPLSHIPRDIGLVYIGYVNSVVRAVIGIEGVGCEGWWSRVEQVWLVAQQRA